MTLRVYNTLSRKKEEFKPLHKGEVRMYVCGPTVYDLSHLGHARSYVAFDVIIKYLRYKGYKVTYVQNLTDVDDKIIKRANEESVPPLELSARFTEEYFKDIDTLGITRPDITPKASEAVEDMIKLIQGLIDKGYAYEVQGDVYFSVRKFQDYTKLSGMKIDEMETGKRIEPSKLKDEPLDFALWKKAKEGEISWDSPWGKGRPGWHIECSAMSMKHLGDTLDIHGGGRDLIFPHHTNEIAQSESYTGKKFVNYWMHNGFVTVNKAKMSKSLKNFSTIRELLKRYDAKTLRFFLVSTHYRSPIDFADVYLEQANASLGKLQNTVDNIKHAIELAEDKKTKKDAETIKAIEDAKNGFIEAMDDDFNTSIAISKMFDIAKAVNKYMETGSGKKVLQAALDAFKELDDILRIFKWETDVGEETKKAVMKLAKEMGVTAADFEKALDALVALREKARGEKDYAKSDTIRDELAKLGIVLEDTDKGARWKPA